MLMTSTLGHLSCCQLHILGRQLQLKPISTSSSRLGILALNDWNTEVHQAHLPLEPTCPGAPLLGIGPVNLNRQHRSAEADHGGEGLQVPILSHYSLDYHHCQLQVPALGQVLTRLVMVVSSLLNTEKLNGKNTVDTQNTHSAQGPM